MRLLRFPRIAHAALALCSWLSWTTASGASLPFRLGVFVGNPNGTTPADEAQFESNFASFQSAMDATPKLITTYVDYTQPVSNWPNDASWQAWSNAQSPVASSLVPVIGLPMATTAPGALTPDLQFQAFAAGQYDSAIQGVVLGWVSYDFRKLIFRPGWEMNITGPTYAGSDPQSQADWVEAFRHIVSVIRRTATQAGARASIVWNPNATNYSAANALTSLYPGDSFVDVVGIDMYGGMYPYTDTQSPPTYHDWATGQEDTSIADFIANPVNRMHYWTYPAANNVTNDASGGHCQSLIDIIQFALFHNKRIAIPETGAGATPMDVADDPTFPQWLAQQLTAAIAAGGRIAFVGVWDSGSYEFSYDADGKPLEREAWQQYFGR